MRAVATMTQRSTIVAMVAAALGMLPLTGAQAQWYSSYPQAPYGGSQERPYAVEVSPNTYVIHRPDESAAPRIEPPASDRPRTHAKRELIEELAKRNNKRNNNHNNNHNNKHNSIETVAVNTTKTVRRKPVV